MASGSIQPFRPAGTASLTAGVSTVSLPLAGGGESVVVTNTTASLAFVRFGADSTVTASAGDMPVLAGNQVMLTVNPLITHAAALLMAGSGTILFTRGDGSYL